MREETALTEEEIEILRAGQKDPNIITDYFFRHRGEERGWRFDDNFTEEGEWQRDVCMASQTDITVIGGFGTGKTLGIGMGACVWCLTANDFKFLNIAQKAWQAQQMYDLILRHARNTRFDDLIWEKPRMPHPKIIIRFRIGKEICESTMEFMSVDKDATGILSWEGDWINLDEAGLLNNLEEIIINVGSRMRGSVRGRERLGRFSMTSNSWDNYQLWYYFDNAMADPENFLSVIVATKDNKNVTEKQYQRMLARIPLEDQQRFLDGGRPEGKGAFFSRKAIEGCEDEIMGEIVEAKAKAEESGYVYERMRGANVVHYRVPPNPRELYLLIGDPGTDSPPKRNAYVLGVWKVTEFPRKPAELVAFVWGSGGGRIQPCIDMLFDLIDVYRPLRVYIDNTGPQKSTSQVINEHLFAKRFQEDGEVGYESPMGINRGINGLDFSGSHKMEYLIAARVFIENRMFRWPKAISGIRAQLANYTPENDKKIAQDIVAMVAMSAHVIRGFFHVDIGSLVIEGRPKGDEMVMGNRRNTSEGRSRRSLRAHASLPPERIP